MSDIDKDRPLQSVTNIYENDVVSSRKAPVLVKQYCEYVTAL